MTVSQAEQIDAKFERFTDSIKNLNGKLQAETAKQLELNAKIRELNNKPAAACIDTLGLGRQLLNANYEIISLKREIDRIKHLEYADKRTRIAALTGLASFVVLWVSYFILK